MRGAEATQTCFMAPGLPPGMFWSLTRSLGAQGYRRQTLCWALGWARTVSGGDPCVGAGESSGGELCAGGRRQDRGLKERWPGVGEG